MSALLTSQTPQDAYARIEFDARVAGAGPRELVSLCYDRLVGDLGTAIHAHARGDNALKSRSLTRALAAVTALQLGVSGEDAVAGALRQLYAAARRAILDSSLAFDPAQLETVRGDFIEIGQVLRAA
jgi:flagellar protein FliS